MCGTICRKLKHKEMFLLVVLNNSRIVLDLPETLCLKKNELVCQDTNQFRHMIGYLKV